MFISQVRKKKMVDLPLTKISVFQLYSREMFSEVVENLIFTRVSVFLCEVSVWKLCCVFVCLCVKCVLPTDVRHLRTALSVI